MSDETVTVVNTNLNGLEILVVDDTPANLEVIIETLSSANYDVSAVTSGKRALKQLQHETPSLILLHIQMPEMDGFETCRKIKANPMTAGIPIIFITALSDAESIVQGLGWVAHEVNNPLGFLNGSISNAQEYVQDFFDYLHLYRQHHPPVSPDLQEKAEEIDLDYLLEDFPKLLNSMQTASDRIIFKISKHQILLILPLLSLYCNWLNNSKLKKLKNSYNNICKKV